MDFKVLVKVGQLQHRRLHQNALQCFEGFVTCFIPIIGDGGFLQEVCQRGRYLRKVLDELAIVGGQSQKGSQGGNRLRRLLIQNRFDLMTVHHQTFLSYPMPKEVHFRHPKFALFKLGIQLVFS